MIQKCWGNIKYLDGAGPSMRNIEMLDMAAMPMIAYMRSNGMPVDLSHFANMEVELARDMEKITEDVRELTGHYCNLDSGDQVAELLFRKLELKQAREKFTKSGDRESVEDEVLTAIQHDHPVVGMIQDFKELSKLLGTYVRPMKKLAVHTAFGEWVLYPKLGQTRVPSGRLNCAEPNLLAMPTRTDRGQEIRKGFPAPEGWVYLSVDASQIEVRAAAHRSQDENLMQVYEDEQDVYFDFATGAFKLPDKRYKEDGGKWKYPGIDKEKHRRPAKTCVLASIYDVTASGLLEQMPVVCENCGWVSGSKDAEGVKTTHDCYRFTSLWKEDNCQDLINSFYGRYGGLLDMRKADHKTMMKYGFLWDDWGRILHSTAVRSVHDWVVAAALREGSNFPIQSLAQGIVKLVMGEFQQDLVVWKMLTEVCKPCLQIHDELLNLVRKDVAEEIADLLIYRFENCVRFRVPLKAGAATANTWGHLEK